MIAALQDKGGSDLALSRHDNCCISHENSPSARVRFGKPRAFPLILGKRSTVLPLSSSTAGTAFDCRQNIESRNCPPSNLVRALSDMPPQGVRMSKRFKTGDRVSWNSEAGRVRGRIVKVHTKDVNYKGYVHHASKDEPQYEIKSDKTDHIALHKGTALRLLGR